MALAAWRDRFGWLIMGAVVTATVISFVLSYRGLLMWAAHHGYGPGWAWVFPACIDLFIVVGEAALFRAVHDNWTRWQMAPAWCAVGCGVVASVAGNAGVEWHSAAAAQVTRGVPPVTLAAMLALGLTVLKHEMSAAARPVPPQPPRPVPEAAPAAAAPAAAAERRPGRPSPPPPRAAPAVQQIRARVEGCPHDGLPAGSFERISAVPDHFGQCLGRPPASNREVASWVQAHWATISKQLNGQLAALRS